ncbi:MAG: homoserine O-acetyltransferase [Microbacteriaceae bacterium]|nr:homoserine O-acetyltransferase [Microbacteriaceae bacterium]
MDWQTPEDSFPSAFVTDQNARELVGKPPATGGWREGDPPGRRRFANLGAFEFERGGSLPNLRVAYETFGTLREDRSNAILVSHALTGDSHIAGPAEPGHPTAGWWGDVVGPGLALDTDEWFVVVPNMLGGCQGTSGPVSYAPDGREWGARFPFTTIRDQVAAQLALADHLGIERWALVVGGSMGGMQAIEWGVTHPERVERLAVLASPAITTADQIAHNALQIEAIRADPAFNGGDYYEAADGEGPHRGLALARRFALLDYRAPRELNERFDRSWQSTRSPLGEGGRFAVESYLDFQGNKFPRRFDANSYITVARAMSSHDVGRDRGGVEAALSRVTMPTLVLAIDSDRLFPVADQERIAAGVPGNIDGDRPYLVVSEFGHDAFLIESDVVGAQLRRLLAVVPARAE